MRSYTRLFLAVILALLVLSSAPLPGTAQQTSGTCPALVENALLTVAESCGLMGRNQVCYGNRRVDASFTAGVALSFSQPADRAAVEQLLTLQTSALDTGRDLWGVAVLNVQADLPDTLPGQMVRFLLLGDVVTANAGSLNQPSIPDPCPGVTSEASNVRSGPGDRFNVIMSMPRGTGLDFTGRDAAGDWLYTQIDGQSGWLATDLVTPACDVQADLPYHDPNVGEIYGPMQAFFFTTGLGTPDCEEVPPSSLVIHSPHNYTVTLSANGVKIILGSTVVLTAPRDGSLSIATLEGQALVSAQGLRQTVPAGFETRVEMARPGPDDAFSPGPISGPTPLRFIERGRWDALVPLISAAFDVTIDIPDMTAWWDVDDFCDDPANAAICADQFLNVSYCGDEVCDEDEDSLTCVRDCEPAGEPVNLSLPGTCGDGICGGFETPQSCPADCLVASGGGEDGTTGGGSTGGGGGGIGGGEEPVGYCGDGICGAGEDACNCSADCRTTTPGLEECN
ncbi:MAG: SH3 domain-containing protein [Anaerolineae bacterium]|nr:SH3 domain-containing protein [Anaerolineae bacterium]